MYRFFASPKIAILGLVLTSCFWAGNIFVSKILIGQVPPFTLNFIRWVIAMMVLVPFVMPGIQQSWPVIQQHKLKLIIYAFLSVTVYNSFLYNAAYTTEAINIAVISTVTPLLTFIFAWCFYGLKPSINQTVGFVIGFLGVMLLLSRGDLKNISNFIFTQGDLWMVLACLSWAIYTVTLVKKPTKISPIIFLFITVSVGVLLCTPFVILELIYSDMEFVFTKKILLSSLYIAIFPSILSFLFFNHGVAVLGSQTASLCAYLIPVFTAIISIVLLNETLYWFHVLSQLLVFLGFYTALMNKGLRD